MINIEAKIVQYIESSLLVFEWQILIFG